MRYTIAELAWFNRCLFWGSTHAKVLELGGSETDAFIISSFIRSNPTAGVVNLYQASIQDEAICSLIEALLVDFFKGEKDRGS